MTSERQIEANRRNAKRSTGPKTVEGKRRSRRNALRHGLTAITVVDKLETPAEYRAMEDELLNEYGPSSVLETELVLRIAALIWRLRRSVKIETELFSLLDGDAPESASSPAMVLLRSFLTTPSQHGGQVPNTSLSAFDRTACGPGELARRYIQLQRRHHSVTTKLERYEMALWRQLAQTVLLVKSGALSKLRWGPFR
jgi:hypothetical protein